MRRTHITQALALRFSSLLLSACGGGGSTEHDDTPSASHLAQQDPATSGHGLQGETG